MSNRTATPAQLGFIESLLTARQGLLELTDVKAFIAEQNYAELTTKAASALIDELKAIKPAPVAPTAGPGYLTNAFPGKCRNCGQTVAANTGRREGSPGNWIISHLDGQCPAKAEVAAPANGFELTDGIYDVDGTIIKVVWNQGHTRLYGKALSARQVGTFECDGTPRFEASWDYVERITAKITSADQKLSVEEAAKFGTLYSFCCNCGFDLSDERSIVAGYGPKCAFNNGWSYPTKAEAAAKITPAQALRLAEIKALKAGGVR